MKKYESNNDSMLQEWLKTFYARTTKYCSELCSVNTTNWYEKKTAAVSQEQNPNK